MYIKGPELNVGIYHKLITACGCVRVSIIVDV